MYEALQLLEKYRFKVWRGVKETFLFMFLFLLISFLYFLWKMNIFGKLHSLISLILYLKIFKLFILLLSGGFEPGDILDKPFKEIWRRKEKK